MIIIKKAIKYEILLLLKNIQYSFTVILSLHDVKQNGIGNCWFMSSLSSLAAREQHISQVVMKAENLAHLPDQG